MTMTYEGLIDVNKEVKTTVDVFFKFTGGNLRFTTDEPETLINKCLREGGIWGEKEVNERDILKSHRTFYPVSSISTIEVFEYYDEIRPFLVEWHREKYGRDPDPDSTDGGLWSSWEAETW